MGLHTPIEQGPNFFRAAWLDHDQIGYAPERGNFAHALMGMARSGGDDAG